LGMDVLIILGTSCSIKKLEQDRKITIVLA
jgi:hypothetical protein